MFALLKIYSGLVFKIKCPDASFDAETRMFAVV